MMRRSESLPRVKASASAPVRHTFSSVEATVSAEIIRKLRLAVEAETAADREIVCHEVFFDVNGLLSDVAKVGAGVGTARGGGLCPRAADVCQIAPPVRGRGRHPPCGDPMCWRPPPPTQAQLLPAPSPTAAGAAGRQGGRGTGGGATTSFVPCSCDDSEVGRMVRVWVGGCAVGCVPACVS